MALLAAGLAVACSGGPKPRGPAAAPTEPAPAEATPTETPAPAQEDAPVPAPVAESPPAETPSPADADAGTRIVLPSQRERDIQKALTGAEEAIASGDAEALLKAADALARSEAVTLPDGARLLERALVRYRELAPEAMAALIALIERTHALVPPTVETLSALGWGYLQVGEDDAAEAAVSSALVLEPFRTDLLLLRAKVLVATDQWYQAQKPLETLLKAEPDNPDALLLQATILWLYAGDGRAAIDVVQNAFATHPEDLRFPELQGRILYDEGQRAEARMVLGSLVARDPKRLDIVRFLLDDAIDRAAWAEAQELLDRLPEPSTAAEILVAHSVARGRGDAAAAALLAERLDALAPDRRYAPLRVRGLIEAGAADRALVLISPALEATRDGGVRSELYYLRAIAGGEPFSDDAVRDLQRSLAENPTNADAMVAMARHFLDSGQARKAQQYARSALRDRPTDQALLDLLRRIEAKLAEPGAQ